MQRNYSSSELIIISINHSINANFEQHLKPRWIPQNQIQPSTSCLNHPLAVQMHPQYLVEMAITFIIIKLLSDIEQSYQQNKMIKNTNDPSGLFSRCARNQAAKIKPHLPPTSTNHPHHPKSIYNKPTLSHFGFQRQESREQRQRRYKKDETPSVGQYSTLKEEKPKMIWDILKVFKKSIGAKERCSIEKEWPSERERTDQQVQSQQFMEQQLLAESSLQQKEEGSRSMINREQSRTLLNKDDSSGAMLTKSQCIVKMSRMTGRKSANNQKYDSSFDYDVLRSLEYIKCKIAKNIDIAERSKGKRRKQKIGGVSSSYQYNYRIVKPESKGLLDFSQAKGRQQNAKTEGQYSYQHYDYDGYVWDSNSRVFPNTKTHLVEFKKQAYRYKLKEKGVGVK